MWRLKLEPPSSSGEETRSAARHSSLTGDLSSIECSGSSLGSLEVGAKIAQARSHPGSTELLAEAQDPPSSRLDPWTVSSTYSLPVRSMPSLSFSCTLSREPSRFEYGALGVELGSATAGEPPWCASAAVLLRRRKKKCCGRWIYDERP